MSESILSNERKCFVCGYGYKLHKHHIYGGGRRKISEQDGCWVYLCAYHHNMSDSGVHFNHPLDIRLKQICEKRWMEVNEATIDDFIQRFGRNYLE